MRQHYYDMDTVSMVPMAKRNLQRRKRRERIEMLAVVLVAVAIGVLLAWRG